MRFLTSAEKKHVLARLAEQHGIPKLDYLFLEAGKEKLRVFSGTLSKQELTVLGAIARVEIVGAYLGREEPFGVRLSFDMTQLLSDKISHHIVDLDESEYLLWMRGHPLPVSLTQGMYIVRYRTDFLGSGYCNGTNLYNYVPKERYIKAPVGS